ncbi:FAD-binding oxidoreductase [Streptomyces armeniacus]|uniref:D-amino-acid oxidase n=1 Tax=Streptomyces armeniacus TaxID=83291 RepID=A0A345XLQ9_9ACTN|nr:FAD-dependent oxidoreductase [Streptomyces armeniacus]AXK32575.1 FAD-binding oxidoreductase [Streptomyces armeniacus]
MREVLIIGGGVIGLTTGVLLAEDGVRVRVWSREGVAGTTSAVAGGLCWPYRIEPAQRAAEWAVRSFATFAELARRPSATGVRMRAGTMVDDPPAAEWAALVGPRTVAPVVDMTTYLPYLQRRLEAAGGRFQQRAPRSLDEVADAAPVVVNCTGLGARELVPDPSLRPIRGQLVVVADPGVEEWYVSAGHGAAESTYVIPQPYGVLLGGTAEEDAEDTEPDPATAEAILARCARVRPELAGAEVLAHRVGLRPYRPSVRLETVRLPGGGVCVHHYGHGGAGITVSWASAEDAVRLASEAAIRRGHDVP